METRTMKQRACMRIISWMIIVTCLPQVTTSGGFSSSFFSGASSWHLLVLVPFFSILLALMEIPHQSSSFSNSNAEDNPTNTSLSLKSEHRTNKEKKLLTTLFVNNSSSESKQQPTMQSKCFLWCLLLLLVCPGTLSAATSSAQSAVTTEHF